MSPLQRQKRRSRGFTLTELMVSLVMGLIVALAAVGLARNATTTFHEQARSSQTEMSIRTASERLKLDLMRASYMSTGNIALDPKVAEARQRDVAGPDRPLRQHDDPPWESRIDPNMANTGTVPPGIAANGFFPDSIDIVGNFTTDDSYQGNITMGSGGIGTGSCNVPQAITLDPNADAATYNLGGGTSTSNFVPATLLANAKATFLPVATQPMLSQVTDAMGCKNYVPVCAVGLNGAGMLVVVVDGVSNARAVLYGSSGDYETANGGTPRCGSSRERPRLDRPRSSACAGRSR